jgi:hypothetical protein
MNTKNNKHLEHITSSEWIFFQTEYVMEKSFQAGVILIM